MEVLSKHLRTLSENLPAFRLENLRSCVRLNSTCRWKLFWGNFFQKIFFFWTFSQFDSKNFGGSSKCFGGVDESCILLVTTNFWEFFSGKISIVSFILDGWVRNFHFLWRSFFAGSSKLHFMWNFFGVFYLKNLKISETFRTLRKIFPACGKKILAWLPYLPCTPP